MYSFIRAEDFDDIRQPIEEPHVLAAMRLRDAVGVPLRALVVVDLFGFGQARSSARVVDIPPTDGNSVEEPTVEIRRVTAAAVAVDPALRLDESTAIARNLHGIVLSDDAHGRRAVIHGQHAAATQREIRRKTCRWHEWTDRGVIRPQSSRLTGCTARRRAVGQVQRGGGLLRKRIGRVVRGDTFEFLAVLIGHQDVLIVGCGPDGVGLPRTACTGFGAEAVDGLPRARIEEDDVTAGDEPQHGDVVLLNTSMWGRTGFAPVLDRQSAATAAPRSIFSATAAAALVRNAAPS